MLRAVVFDLDGTLLDTLDDLTAAVGHAFSAFGLPSPDRARVQKYVGNGVAKLVERALCFAETGREPDPEGESRSEYFSPCMALFSEYYDAHNADKTRPYPGVCNAIAELKAAGYKTAIVTNKYDSAAQELKRRFFGDVDILVGARPDIRPKPHPDGVDEALKFLGVQKSEAVYVGDGETDIATAKNAGLPVIAVGWGFREREFLMRLGPDAFAETPWELVDIISGMTGKEQA